MHAMLEKAKITAYGLLRQDGSQSKAANITEYIIDAVICLNVVLIIMESVERGGKYASVLNLTRMGFFIFFLAEYLLRVWVSDLAVQNCEHPIKARIKYIFSFKAILNLLALLPVMMGGTFIDFRIFRVLRLIRVTQLKSLKKYTNTLGKVLRMKGAQLISSFVILFIFMLVSAVIVYDLESKVQPDVFKNVLSGLWWSTSAITTIGYGDMYPITPFGKLLGSIVSIFGVFIMAIPIGILTSGFFEISKNSESIHDKKRRK